MREWMEGRGSLYFFRRSMLMGVITASDLFNKAYLMICCRQVKSRIQQVQTIQSLLRRVIRSLQAT